MTLFPYAAYMMADGLELSGIVAILFAGIVRQRKHAQHLHENIQKNCYNNWVAKAQVKISISDMH